MTVKIAKYVSLAALAVVAVATTASCSREEDDIWERSAAERLNDAKNADIAILCAAQHGWEMLYFTESDAMGVNFVMKFNTNGSVTIAADNAHTGGYKEETSAFDVITDDGPVLTFNTYNSLFHRYADPDPDHSQDTDGVGDGGDYEFKIMSISNEMIYMRGKKHGAEIYMYPLSDDNWEQYFIDVNDNLNRMFNASIPTLWVTLADGKRYSITKAATQVMDMVPEGGDAITETSTLSYVATRNGFRWMNAFPGNSDSSTPAREFVFNSDGTYLVSTDFGGVAGATIKAPVLSELIPMEGTTWRINPDKLGGSYATAYKRMADDIAAIRAGYNLEYAEFSYDPTNKVNSIALGVSGGKARVYCVMSPDGETSIKIDFNDATVKDKEFSGEEARSGRRLIGQVPAIVDFCNVVSSANFKMSVTDNSELLPKEIKFENTINANDYFYVNLQ